MGCLCLHTYVSAILTTYQSFHHTQESERNFTTSKRVSGTSPQAREGAELHHKQESERNFTTSKRGSGTSPQARE